MTHITSFPPVFFSSKIISSRPRRVCDLREQRGRMLPWQWRCDRMRLSENENDQWYHGSKCLLWYRTRYGVFFTRKLLCYIFYDRLFWSFPLGCYLAIQWLFSECNDRDLIINFYGNGKFQATVHVCKRKCICTLGWTRAESERNLYF